MTLWISCDPEFHDQLAQATYRARPMLYDILLMRMTQPHVGHYYLLALSMSFHFILLLFNKAFYAIPFLFLLIPFYLSCFCLFSSVSRNAHDIVVH